MIADKGGVDTPDVQAAEDEAVLGLTIVAGVPMMGPGSRKLIALVRTDRGEVVRRVALTLQVEGSGLV